MADEKFVYDPETEEASKGTGLPFGLCKARGIKIEDWWTPKDAWQALQNGGYVDDVSEEYKEYFCEKKRKMQEQRRKITCKRAKRIAQQTSDPAHTPDKTPSNDGEISGAAKSKPMTFEEADSGNVNPYYNSGYIGYAHNCQTCVAVYYARRKGYDVTALPNLNNIDIYNLSRDTSLAYIDEQTGKHPHQITKCSGQKVDAFIDFNIKEGEIHTLQYQYTDRNSGHIIIAEKVNGKIRLYDPQINKTYTTANEIASKLKNTMQHKMMNLSACRLDERFCDKIMKRRQK